MKVGVQVKEAPANKAFVQRIAPSGIDRLDEALRANQLIIGWSKAVGLLDPSLKWDDFRQIVGRTYYKNEDNLRKAGSAAGHLWRFIREMSPGDLVVVPHGPQFYVGEVTGPALHIPKNIAQDTAYRRDVNWLNKKHPIPRGVARSALLSRMKSQGTCSGATDLYEQVQECLKVAASGERPTFATDLQSRLVKTTLEEIQSGRMENFGFERLIETVVRRLGAAETRIVPRSEDKGADIVAVFLVAGTFRQVVAIQAKHWQPKPPVGVGVVEQLIRGIEAESANLGMIITSGTISEEAAKKAEQYFEENGIRIELLDGQDFAKLIVESGIRT